MGITATGTYYSVLLRLTALGALYKHHVTGSDPLIFCPTRMAELQGETAARCAQRRPPDHAAPEERARRVP